MYKYNIMFYTLYVFIIFFFLKHHFLYDSRTPPGRELLLSRTVHVPTYSVYPRQRKVWYELFRPKTMWLSHTHAHTNDNDFI